MSRSERTVVAGVAVAVLLAGCAGSGTAAPSTPPAAPTTAASPTAAATSAAPTPSAMPSATPAAGASSQAAPMCDVAQAVDPERASTVSWSGTYEERLARADPQPGFSPAEILPTDGVLCTISFQQPIDGDSGVGGVSRAYVRDPGFSDAVREWALAHGYEAHGDAVSYPELILGDEPYEAKLRVYPLDWQGLGSNDLAEHERTSGLDLEPSDWVVWHVDFVLDDEG